MRPCLGKNPRTGAVEIDPDRTSTAANIPRSEVPTISAKLAALARCDVRQLETFQVLHYLALEPDPNPNPNPNPDPPPTLALALALTLPLPLTRCCSTRGASSSERTPTASQARPPPAALQTPAGS